LLIIDLIFAFDRSANQTTPVAQPVAVTNPFGTLPAMPHMSIGNTGISPSIQYGISSMPVSTNLLLQLVHIVQIGMTLLNALSSSVSGC